MIWLILSLFVIIADQAVKYGIVSHVGIGDTIGAMPGILDIVYVQNTGAAFNILSGRLSLLSMISIVFCICVIVYFIWKKPKQPLLCCALALMFSGALGNAIDRVLRGYVVDYIKLTFINFPVFNIADIAITLGAVLIVVYVIFFDEEK